MPANLPPSFKDAELRLHRATTIDEKEDALREMIALLPRHKGTEKLQADLRKRLSKLEDEAAHARRSGGHHAEPGHVAREGAGQWVIVGPPNAGKSSLLAALTHAHPEIAEYPFTTREPLPGMAAFEDVLLQLVDTPPVAGDRTPPWLPALVRGADGVLVVLDVAGDDLEAGLRDVESLLVRARVRPAGRAPAPEESPVVVARPVRVLLAKGDLDDDGTFEALAREATGDLPVRVVSAARGDGLEALKADLFHDLHRIRIHTREPGHAPDTGRPFVLAEGATVEELALRIHHDVAQHLKFARLWGPHARFAGQQVDRHHVLGDGDEVELHA